MLLRDDRCIFGEEHWAELDGYWMRYLKAGHGPPVVLVHGLLGYSFSWRFNWQVLASNHTVYAVDLLGIGFSDRPPVGAVPMDLFGTADRMLRWMGSLGLRCATVVGTSHGGGVSIAMAGKDQQRRSGLISNLVLVAPVNPWSNIGRRRVRLFRTRVGAAILKLAAPLLGFSRSAALGRMYGDSHQITPETLAGYRKPLRLPRSIDYGLAIVKTWTDDISQLQTSVELIRELPVLLVWGDRDRLVPISSGHELKHRLKGAEMVVMEGVGHLPYEENPDEFNRILLRFLNE